MKLGFDTPELAKEFRQRLLQRHLQRVTAAGLAALEGLGEEGATRLLVTHSRMDEAEAGEFVERRKAEIVVMAGVLKEHGPGERAAEVFIERWRQNRGAGL